jgi:hypothetical protein
MPAAEAASGIHEFTSRRAAKEAANVRTAAPYDKDNNPIFSRLVDRIR